MPDGAVGESGLLVLVSVERGLRLTEEFGGDVVDEAHGCIHELAKILGHSGIGEDISGGQRSNTRKVSLAHPNRGLYTYSLEVSIASSILVTACTISVVSSTFC